MEAAGDQACRILCVEALHTRAPTSLGQESSGAPGPVAPVDTPRFFKGKSSSQAQAVEAPLTGSASSLPMRLHIYHARS